MANLKEKMTPRECHQFTTAGYFTIRRSEKFWSGIFFKYDDRANTNETHENLWWLHPRPRIHG